MQLLNSNKPTFLISFFWFFILLFNCPEINAQEYIYQNFGVDDGLPSSEIYDSYQDKEGYIWFATDKGLSRYNGYEFENFDMSDGLTGNVVLKFYPQTNGQIWCYTYHNKSIFYFDEIFNGFTPYKFNDVLKTVLHEGSTIKSIFIDTSNNLHFGGIGINGEIIINNDGQLVNNFMSKSSFLDTTGISKMVLMNYENSLSSPLYFTTKDTSNFDSGFLQINHSSTKMIVRPFADFESAVFMTDSIVEINIKNQEIISIHSKHTPIGLNIIDSTNFLVGYLYGGAKIIDKNGTIKKEFLKDKSITSFLIDHEGGYWFTTHGSGLYYIERPSTIICNSVKTKYNDISGLAKTNNPELLIAYKDGTIAKFSNFRNPTIIDQHELSYYTHVEYDLLNDILYFSNDSGLKKQTLANNITNQCFLKLSEPKDKTIFAASSHGFFSINENQEVTSFPRFRVHDVCVWNNDTLIASPKGVFVYKSGRYDSLSDQSELFNYRCEDIDVNSKNIMFAATQGAGIIVHDGSNVFSIQDSDGLNSNVVNEIHIENDSTIWACTNNGINRIIFDGDTTYITGINKKEGLLSNEVEDIEIMNDTVWVGAKQGLCAFPKEQMNPKKTDIPYLKLKNLIVNNVSQDPLASASLTYKENEIDFILEGISYGNKDKLYYKYRVNKNLNWSSTQNRRIQFSSLSPGSYTFEAKVCLDDYNCSEKTIQYEFSVLHPFWKRWWFIFLCLCLFALVIYTFFKIRVLTYNKDITREFIRLLVKQLKRKEKYFYFRENGKDIRIESNDIIYVKSAGNYIDVHTENKTYTVRMKIGKFSDNVPDKLEYIRLHRSYIARIDKIKSKSRNEVQLTNDIRVPVSLNHHKNLKEILF